MTDVADVSVNRKPRFSNAPTAEELLPYVQGLRTKRLRKKFLKRPGAYIGKWIPQSVFFDWFGRVLVMPMLHQMRSEGMLRRVLVTTPLRHQASNAAPDAGNP